MGKITSFLSTLSIRVAFYILFRKVTYYIFRKVSKTGYFERISYSQGAEDLILNHIFKDQNSGFFVDVGCNHPVDCNNTFLFYLNNWRGINIDGNEELVNLYKLNRPYDISINALVSDGEHEVKFYQSSSDKVSTIDPNFYNSNKGDFDYPEDKIMYLQTTSLTSILKSYYPKGKKIDLLTIDVEGNDFNVLKGLDFNIFYPKVICIECHGLNLQNLNENEVYNYLVEKGYQLKYHAISSCFFVCN